jgi:hypothetical protein
MPKPAKENERLEPLIGEWSMAVVMPGQERPDPLPGTFLQHYFDTRGVARIYEMSLAAGVWKLERTKADFSPFEFSQRFSGSFVDGGRRIEGTWEISDDHKTWRKDFDLIYTRL